MDLKYNQANQSLPKTKAIHLRLNWQVSNSHYQQEAQAIAQSIQELNHQQDKKRLLKRLIKLIITRPKRL
tara:strand:- start:3307 stop:3516 length:210 start_codon:yes stop_codon:yes gene_type:complete